MCAIKISLIVPVYNAERTIKKCIESIISQSLKEIEIICINDGSSDKSLEILKYYKEFDNRLVIISRKNRGVGYSRNEGIKTAKGEYIGFVDADDYYPNREVLNELYSNAKQSKKMVCGGSLIIYNEESNEFIKCKDRYNYFNKKSVLTYESYQYEYGFQRFIYNRKFIVSNNISFPLLKRYQDPPFMAAALAKAKEFYAISDYTYVYRLDQKHINWNKEKIAHLMQGLYTVLKISVENNLFNLFDRAIDRINKEYSEILKKFNFKFLENLKTKINKYCIENSKATNLKKNIKVSIVVPIFNAELYLKECLESLANQTLSDIEVICINDGSTDNSLRIVQDFVKKDNRFRYINKINRGYGQTVNCGITKSFGEYIGIVEPDDFVKPKMFERLYSIAKSNNLDFIKSDSLTFLTDNNKYVYSDKKLFNSNNYYNKVILDKNNKTFLTTMTINPSGIYNRKFLLENNIFHNETPGASYQDNGFWLKTTYLAKRFYFLSEAYYCYRQDNPNQSMKKKNNIFTIPNEYKYNDSLFINNPETNLYYEFYLFRKFKAYIYHMKERIDKKFWNFYLEYISKEFVDELPLISKGKVFTEYDLNDLNMICKNRLKYMAINGIDVSNYLNDEIIVTLTTYPKRIKYVHKTIQSLIDQNLKAKKIVLWLAKEEFPNKEEDLPQDLLKLKGENFSICWCENLKSYKKLIPSLKKFPNSILITADDDLLYPKYWLEKLYLSYLDNKEVVWCHRSHRIQMDGNSFKKYKDWIFCQKNSDPSFLNFCTTGGGVLYPPKIFYKDVFKKNIFMKYFDTTDDIWFWSMVVLNNKKIQVVKDGCNKLEYIDGTQDENNLWIENIEYKNDLSLNILLKYYPHLITKLLN